MTEMKENICSRCWEQKQVDKMHFCEVWEKEVTWQTVYEQLQEIVNKCIELWRLNKIFDKWCYVLEDWVYNNKWWRIPIYSYHDLFSKDSWLMEFVEWEDKNLPNWYYMFGCLHGWTYLFTTLFFLLKSNFAE